MPGTPCANHADRDAVGNCGRCHRFFCGTCLGLDSKMQPICAQCLEAPNSASTPSLEAPKMGMGGLDALKHQVVDDDPLGLLGGPISAEPAAHSEAEKKVETESALDEDAMETDQDIPALFKPAVAPQAPHSAPAVPAIPPGSLLEDLVKSSAPTLAAVPAPVAAPAAPPIPAVPSVSKAPVESAPAYGAPVVPTPPQPASLPPLTKQAPTLDKPVAASLDDLLASPKPPPPASAPAAPVEKASAPNVPGGGLDDFFSTTIAKPKLPTIDPVTPVKPNPGVSISGASPLASLGLEKPPMPSLDPGFSDLKSPTAAPRSEKDKPAKEKKPGRISRLMKSRVRVAKVKIPFLVLVVLVLALLGAGGIVVAFAGGAPTLQILNTLAPLQIVQMDSGEVTDMDITTYSDIQSNLQAMHFNDFLQMTVPQLPAPNFFDVQMKSKAFTYAEIIKMPGDLTPVLSYVTVFTNGVWYSTNGWAGKDHNMSYLVSGFYPNDDPNQLYAVHIQGLNQLESDNGWEPETMGQNRYMSALTDHLRWYLNLKGLAGYQAQFADWH